MYLVRFERSSSGFVTAEHIDRGLTLGAAHPMGPLALADLIGLDTTKVVAESLYEELRSRSTPPPRCLARMVDGGLLGRKSERGFYTYWPTRSRSSAIP